MSTERSAAADPISLLDGLATTRAIRRYTADPIPDDDLADDPLARRPRAVGLEPPAVPLPRAARRTNTRAAAGAARRVVPPRAGNAHDATRDGYRPRRQFAELDAALRRPLRGRAGDRARVPRALSARRRPYEGASVYPACQNLLLAARALGYGGALTDVAPRRRGRAPRTARRSPTASRCRRASRSASRPATTARCGASRSPRSSTTTPGATLPTGSNVPAMTLVAGVDSSTQSTKVEVRDLETGRVVGSGTSPHPTVTPPVSEQDPGDVVVGVRVGVRLGARRGGRGTTGVAAVDAISVGGQQHGMVALDRDDRAGPPGEAVERHRVRARCGTGSSDSSAVAPAGRAAWAAATGQCAGRRVHGHEAVVAPPHASRGMGAGRAGSCCRTTS